MWQGELWCFVVYLGVCGDVLQCDGGIIDVVGLVGTVELSGGVLGDV